jgi:tetratricopeptide (TPR) repeat protein
VRVAPSRPRGQTLQAHAVRPIWNSLSSLKRYDMAAEIEPHDAEAHFAQAQVLEAMNRTDQALAAYFRTLEFNPLHPQASLRIGAIRLARNQPDQAVARDLTQKLIVRRMFRASVLRLDNSCVRRKMRVRPHECCFPSTQSISL